MRMLISFAALFLSVLLLQISSGGVGPLDALSGIELGFTRAQIGTLGSAHFLGFFVGCWWAPRLMGAVGHSRAFAVFTALGAIGLLAHMLVIDPWFWAGFRVATGLCVAGCYTVIESWLQAKVTNETRGRTMGIYRVIDMSGSIVAQLMIAVLEPAHYVSYNILALFICASLLPLSLTRVAQPIMPAAPRLRPKLAWGRSPLAVAGVLVAGVSSASFRMVSPIYGQEVGLANEQIAYLLAFFVLGGALAQYPAGWLADKYDRRWVLIWFSAASVLGCGVMLGLGSGGTAMVMLGAGIFGLVSFPIYSISAAHAYDFAASDEQVELAAALLFWFAIGAIVAPYLAAVLIDGYGPNALFLLIAVAHVVLVVVGLLRMRARPTVTTPAPYVYAPRTSFIVGRLIRRGRKP